MADRARATCGTITCLHSFPSMGNENDGHEMEQKELHEHIDLFPIPPYASRVEGKILMCQKVEEPGMVVKMDLNRKYIYIIHNKYIFKQN